MADSNISLTKTCKNCGLEKPLSAFLILAGPEGGTYGSLCSDCRKTAPQPAPESSTTSTTGVKIDSKAKVQSEVDKRKLRKQITENYFDEREKRSQTLIKRTEKIIGKAREEIKHRSFLETRKPTTPPPKQAEIPVHGGETQKSEARKFDFRGPVVDTQIAGKVKHQYSDAFKKFKTWLGNSAPIVQAAERAAKNPKAEEKPELAPLNKSKKP